MGEIKFQATLPTAESWCLLEVLFKISDEHALPFNIGVSPHLGHSVPMHAHVIYCNY